MWMKQLRLSERLVSMKAKPIEKTLFSQRKLIVKDICKLPAYFAQSQQPNESMCVRIWMHLGIKYWINQRIS